MIPFFSYKIYFFALKDRFMVDLPLSGSFISFLVLAVGFFEELPLDFLMSEGEGLAFLAGVLALGGAFLGSGLTFPLWAAGTLRTGLDPLCFMDAAFPWDLAGVFFCKLWEQKNKGYSLCKRVTLSRQVLFALREIAYTEITMLKTEIWLDFSIQVIHKFKWFMEVYRWLLKIVWNYFSLNKLQTCILCLNKQETTYSHCLKFGILEFSREKII